PSLVQALRNRPAFVRARARQVGCSARHVCTHSDPGPATAGLQGQTRRSMPIPRPILTLRRMCAVLRGTLEDTRPDPEGATFPVAVLRRRRARAGCSAEVPARWRMRLVDAPGAEPQARRQMLAERGMLALQVLEGRPDAIGHGLARLLDGVVRPSFQPEAVG